MGLHDLLDGAPYDPLQVTQRYIHPDMASAHYAINSLDKGKAIK